MDQKLHQSAVAISERGLRLIATFEGFSAKPYLDAVKIPTIGYGATYYPGGKKVTMSDPPITKERGMALLGEMVKDFEDAVNKAVTVPLTQTQFDALVSFAYNVGIKAFMGSTLLKLLNQGKYHAAAQEFGKWTKAGGKELAGLVARRRKEKELFLKG